MTDSLSDYYRKELLTLDEFCFTMIRRANIEGSKCNVAMSAGQPHKPVIPVGGRGWSSWPGRVDPMTHLNKTGWSVIPVVTFLIPLA